MSGRGGNTETRTTTVQSNDPWSASQPYLKDAMERAGTMLEEGQGFNPFPDSTVVPYSTATRGAMGGVLNMAQGGTPGTDLALRNAQNVLSGGGAMAPLLDIASGSELEGGNPYLMRALEPGADEIQNRIGNEAAAIGRSGSGAMAGRMADSLGDYYSGALAADYTNARNRQMQAANTALQSGLAYGGQVPGLESARYDPFGRIMDIGSMQEDLATRELLDEVRRFEGNQQADWTRLMNAQGIFSGAGALGGQSSATQYVQQPRPNPWTQAAGLGLTAAGLFGGF